MSFSVNLSKWVEWVRLSVVELEKKFPTASFGTYGGHDPNESHAADAMIPAWQTASGRAVGDRLFGLITKTSFMRPRGMWYAIWNGKIWSMTRPGAGALPYFDRNSTNPSRSHKNHVHMSWYAKKPASATIGNPAPYTDGWVPATPWIFYLDKQKAGVTESTSVWLIQKALGNKPYDGDYDNGVRDAVKKWQLEKLGDDPKYCDGILGRLQARSLFGPDVVIEESSE